MSLTLKINIVDFNITKTIGFPKTTTVKEACEIILQKCPKKIVKPDDYGLFLTSTSNETGIWLKPNQLLQNYNLKNTQLEYRKKKLYLRVKMLDETLKTIPVDISENVTNLMKIICEKFGILKNHDEYSLVFDEANQKIERDLKMSQLRQKLHTDDEVNWLAPTKTLPEQGIDESKTVILRKKFFFYDQNINIYDPIQLHVLYIEVRDAILKGIHPVTLKQALQFAGLQCQIQFGDYVETKHKPGLMDLKEFLPKSYIKKGIESKIYKEHKKNSLLSELQAKLLYTRNARALETYGVTLFLVKEKMNEKDKLVPRLLGVTKDAILRLNEETKEIIQCWPLTMIENWTMTLNTFTLNFGNYIGHYYSVQTPYVKKIQQLISGYISISMKKQQEKPFHVSRDQTQMVEEIIQPNIPSFVQHGSQKVNKFTTGLITISETGAVGEKSFSTGIMNGPQQVAVSGSQRLPMVQRAKIITLPTEPQQALFSTISATNERIHEIQNDLENPNLSDHHQSSIIETFDTIKQNIISEITAMNASTAHIVILTSNTQNEIDYTAIEADITNIGRNLQKTMENIRKIMDNVDNKDKVIDATKKLCTVYAELIQPEELQPKQLRENLQKFAPKIGKATIAILTAIGEESSNDILSYIKPIRNSISNLIVKAKSIGSSSEDLENRVSDEGSINISSEKLSIISDLSERTYQSRSIEDETDNSLLDAAKQLAEATTIMTKRISSEDKIDLNESYGFDTIIQLITNLHNQFTSHPNDSQEDITPIIKTINENILQLLNAVTEGNEMNVIQIARNIADNLKNFVKAVTTDDHIITMSQKLLTHSVRLINEAQRSLNLVTVTPELQLAVDDISSTLRSIEQISPLHIAAGNLKKAISNVCISPSASNNVLLALHDLQMKTVGLTSDITVREKVVHSLQSVSTSTSKFVRTAESLTAKPYSQNELASTARTVIDSINSLLNDCNSISSDEDECDSAIRQIQTMSNLLENLSQDPIKGITYHELLDSVIARSKDLGERLKGITQSVKESQHERFAEYVRSYSNGICSLIESSVQFVSLMGLVDETQFTKAVEAIRKSCNTLTSPISQNQIVDVFMEIREYTRSLCTSCRLVSLKTSNLDIKQKFGEYTKIITEATSALVNNPKDTQPLLDAVNQVSRYVSLSSFQHQEIIISCKILIDSSCNAIGIIKKLVKIPKDRSTWQQFSLSSQKVSESIKQLVSTIRDGSPGRKECENAITILRNIDKNYPLMTQNRDRTLSEFIQQVENSSATLYDTIELLSQTAKTENIGYFVNQLVQNFEMSYKYSIEAISNVTNSEQQKSLLKLVKTVTETTLQFIDSLKDYGDSEKEIDECAKAIQQLVSTLKSISAQSLVVDELTRSITAVQSNTDDRYDQTEMIDCSKEIVKIAKEITSTDTQKGAQFYTELSQKYGQLSQNSFGAKTPLHDAVQQLGKACIELIKTCGQKNNVTEEAVRIVTILQSENQESNKGTSTISGIIGDLEATLLFVKAGNLNPENQEEFSDYQEKILETLKVLVEDTKNLLEGSKRRSEQLTIAMKNSVVTIGELAKVVKSGAASLGSDNKESQELLINSVRDIAIALSDLIQTATVAAVGKSTDDPAVMHLKESAKATVNKVTLLLKLVRRIEDEHTQGSRALEFAVEAIEQELTTFHSRDGCKSDIAAEDLIRCSKQITQATTKSVSAGISNKQEDVIDAANMIRTAVLDTLLTCKSTAFYLAETEELRKETFDYGNKCAEQFLNFLKIMLKRNESQDFKQNLLGISKIIAELVKEVFKIARTLKGGDWIDPDDPAVIAEKEFLTAAASIEAAAKKLASLEPRQNFKVQNPDETLNFDEMILTAAKSITTAISALINAASAAQHELIASGKMSRNHISLYDSTQWSEGLISAARLVASAIHSLVESANALVQGLEGEEKLIAAAKQVASSTVQLLIACKVKAEGETEVTRRLQSAGNAVKRATDNLVRAAQQAQDVDEERCLNVNRGMVGGIAQEMNAIADVYRIERELEEAKSKLGILRQTKYQIKGEYDLTI